MKKEFNIGDIAHMSKDKRVKGLIDYKTENYKNFTLKLNEAVKIIHCNKADERLCGGHSYDCEVKYEDIIYIVECIPQFNLFPKKLWKQNIEMMNKIKEFEKRKIIDSK